MAPELSPPAPAFLQEPHEEELHVEPPVAEQATSVVELARKPSLRNLLVAQQDHERQHLPRLM